MMDLPKAGWADSILRLAHGLFLLRQRVSSGETRNGRSLPVRIPTFVAGPWRHSHSAWLIQAARTLDSAFSVALCTLLVSKRSHLSRLRCRNWVPSGTNDRGLQSETRTAFRTALSSDQGRGRKVGNRSRTRDKPVGHLAIGPLLRYRMYKKCPRVRSSDRTMVGFSILQSS